MARAVKYVKTYVDVLVKMRTDGTFIPVSVSIAFSIPDSFLSGVTLDKEVIVF